MSFKISFLNLGTVLAWAVLLAIFSLSTLSICGWLQRKPCTAITTREITHVFKHKFCNNREAQYGKEWEQIKKILRIESSNTENYNDNSNTENYNDNYLYFF